jgi:hypothetical protein
VGGACGTHGREKCTMFLWESPWESDHSEDRDADAKIRSECILGRFAGGLEWVKLAQGRDWRRVLANTVMNLRVLAPRS